MRLNMKLADAKANVIVCSREQLVAGMRIFKRGDITNKKFQADIFDTFLKAVYLFDDKCRLVFSFAEGNDTLEIPTEALAGKTDMELIYEDKTFGQGCARPTSDSYPNTIEPAIRMYGGFGVFVFEFPIYTF